MTDTRLSVITGPPRPAVELAGDEPLLIGRSSRCDIRLDDPSVSRRHARLQQLDGAWAITDLGSRHGIAINGVSIDPETPTALSPGDRLRIGPWMFRFGTGHSERSTLHSIDDTGAGGATRIPAEQLGALAQKRLSLLMESARSIHSASSEAEVAEAVVDALRIGSGFDRAVLLRSTGDFDELDIIAMRGVDESAASSDLRLSKNLLVAASEGGVAKLEDNPDLRGAVSIISSGVTGALCAPISVGEGIDSYAYLDSSGASQPHPDAAAFCAVIADLCGLAFANLRRHALEIQQQRLLQDLQLAHDVQRRLMPASDGRAGPIAYALHFQPGRVVAGDFFGIVPLGEHAAACFLGDVAGKGLGASLIMATVQSHLEALLDKPDALVETVRRLNDYIARRSATNEFASLWIGVIDAQAGRLEIVDAGHGYAMLVRPDETPALLEADGGPPIGVEEGFPYQRTMVDFRSGERLVLFSDGVPEQTSPEGEQFGNDRAARALRASDSMAGDLRGLLECVAAHAQSDHFGDDVTIASLRIADA